MSFDKGHKKVSTLSLTYERSISLQEMISFLTVLKVQSKKATLNSHITCLSYDSR